LDSITQAALGAAVGEAVLGRKIGRQALLWGAVVGTLPDLDVLIQFADPVASFTYHRGFSHSWLIHLLVSPLFAWLLTRLRPHSTANFRNWILFVFLCLSTHALLDACTIYGTQLFWPFDFPPVGWGFIFIIDPLYTMPLIVGVTAVILLKRDRPVAHRINTIALIVSSAYLLTALTVKIAVISYVDQQLTIRDLTARKILATPMPFNILLWRVIVLDQAGYYEGFSSVFDRGNIILRHTDNDYNLMSALQDHWPVRRLDWFTNGFYAIQKQDDDVVMSDIRMGAQGAYPFSFRVARINKGRLEPVAAEYVAQPSYDVEDLRWVFRRITDESLDTKVPLINGLDKQRQSP
jgi:inner membrane protein